MAASTSINEPSNEQGLLAITNSLGSISLHRTPDYELVDTPAAISTLVDSLDVQPTTPPSLYIDLEGVKLSRHGSISILQVFVSPSRRTYLVDIHTLRDEAFSTRGANGRTLKEILESDAIPKVFFDVRNDSDALFAHFGVRLRGVEDVQLMENAARPTGRRRFVNGLERCINTDAGLSLTQRTEWKSAKERGLRLFHPDYDGSYEVFNTRPMSIDIIRYCVNDVVYLPQLRQVYWTRLDAGWRTRVVVETRRRVQQSQAPGYQPQGEHKKYGPW